MTNIESTVNISIKSTNFLISRMIWKSVRGQETEKGFLYTEVLKEESHLTTRTSRKGRVWESLTQK